ncbi:MAG: helix-hairpin-helix domain-containing protein [Anaerolineae bacterium]
MSWVTIVIIVVAAIIILLVWWWLGRRPSELGAPYQPSSAATRGAEQAAPEAPPVREAERWAEAPPPVSEATRWAEATAPAVEVEREAKVEAPAEVTPQAEAAAPAVEVEPSAPDDLQMIEGIGPKIAAMLQAHGITTFAQLAATDVERLRDIMLAANLRIADPTTWPQQAALAAAGKWDELRALQDSLKGGRRV